MTDSLLPDNNAQDFYNQAVEHFEQSDYQASIACCNKLLAEVGKRLRGKGESNHQKPFSFNLSPLPTSDFLASAFK